MKLSQPHIAGNQSQREPTEESAAAPVSSEQFEEFYRQMFVIRRFEETALDLFRQGLLNGTIHTCIGQEACAVAVVNAIDKQRDIVFSNHRGHGHFLALTDNLDGLLCELMGRACGVCGGVGGSQHLYQGNFYSNGIQGGIVPIATGIALAEKLKRTGAISVVFLGDGTMGEGIVYESFNIAATWQLPVLYVIENNGYAQTTPLALAHHASLADRPSAFGVRTVQASGFDVAEAYSAAAVLVRFIRSECQPGCLHLDTYRLAAHSKGDDTRDPEEVRSFLRRDPVLRMAQLIPDSRRHAIEAAVQQRVRAAVERAKAERAQDFVTYRNRCVAAEVYAP
ncbi:MAG: thiamine pyrophosphate-dependent dehydrogenase E1 component subunit alpha [Chloroflexi bacterium]|nr:thiamine pyrophosphate-dependent dehydrogenase E1 component subunit alpha [Chloroflexota bacterium]